MPQIAGATFWLEIDGVRLEEFGTERDKTENTVVCWVPCAAGKDFRFGVSLEELAPRSQHYRFAFELDGTRIPPENVQRRTIRRTSKCTQAHPVYYEGQIEEKGLRPFRFATVRLTDDDSHMSDALKLGDIVVTVNTFTDYREEVVKRGKSGKKKIESMSLGEAVVHERAKKGLTNCVQFGELRPLAGSSSQTQGKSRHTTTLFAVGLKTVGKIIFKYRQMDILIADGIAPKHTPQRARIAHRDASSSRTRDAATPNLDDDDVEVIKVEASGDDDTGKLERLKARAAALRELCDVETQIEALELQKPRKRVRGGDASTPAPKRVKKEPTVQHFAPGEVIDLT